MGLKKISYGLFLLLWATCTDPFVIETREFENVLIVESLITNEDKRHLVKLSRTIPLEGKVPKSEGNANVRVEADNGQIFEFSYDDTTGHYLSDQAFYAKPGIGYSLKVDTEDGRSFASDKVTLPPLAEIERVYTEPIVEGGLDGIKIYVDSEESSGQAEYFRYEYEATYKIKVPKPTDWNWVYGDYDFVTGNYDVQLTYKKPEIICYSSDKSSGIFQTSTAEFDQNRVFRYPLKFIYKGDHVLRERYSILVKQYVQNLGAYTFYRTLNDLGFSSSLLSQGQPGFVPGNLISLTDPDEKVVGFFEASAVTTKRIYFNYKDFGFEFPPYFEDCTRIKILPNAVSMDLINRQHYQIQDYETAGPWKLLHLYKEACTDCTTFSSNIKPDFWEE